MSNGKGFETREAIDASGTVARCWWGVASEKGPQTFGSRSRLGKITRMTAAGTDAEGGRVVLHARQGEGHSSVRIGNVDTRAAAILHLSGGEVDTESILAAGTDLDRLAGLEGVTEEPVESGFKPLVADLQSV